MSAGPTPSEDPWVVSQAYQGPNRRRRAAWFSRKARLDDAHAVAADAESTDTLLRRVSLWGGLSAAARDRRAAFVAILEALAVRGREGRQPVWPEIVAAAARYVRSVGAAGTIDEPLLNDALLAAQRARAENGHSGPQDDMLKRLEAAARAGR